MDTRDPSGEPATRADDAPAQGPVKPDRPSLDDHLITSTPVVIGTFQKGQSFDDFKAKLKASLIRQGLIREDDVEE